MGVQFLDQFSLSYLAASIVAYSLGVPIWLWIIINAIYNEFIDYYDFGVLDRGVKSLTFICK